MAGELAVIDVYQGLGATVKRGSIKYIRVVQEMQSNLEKLPGGRLKETYDDFLNYYAGPIDYPIWPAYVAKGVLGVAPVEEDGSAHFEAPAGKTLYLQALDADFNEVQRMRSVMQLQPGETRGCVGCHENRLSTGTVRHPRWPSPGPPPSSSRRPGARAPSPTSESSSRC